MVVEDDAKKKTYVCHMVFEEDVQKPYVVYMAVEANSSNLMCLLSKGV